MESLEGIEKKAVSDILTERGFEVLPAGEEKHGVGLSGSLDQNLNYAAFQMECRDGSVKIRYGSPTGFFRGLGEPEKMPKKKGPRDVTALCLTAPEMGCFGWNL